MEIIRKEFMILVTDKVIKAKKKYYIWQKGAVFNAKSKNS